MPHKCGHCGDELCGIPKIHTVPSEDNEIKAFIHCRECLKELPEGMSPRDYARLEVGVTPEGIQVWCKRHEVNVVHISNIEKRV